MLNIITQSNKQSGYNTNAKDTIPKIISFYKITHGTWNNFYFKINRFHSNTSIYIKGENEIPSSRGIYEC